MKGKQHPARDEATAPTHPLPCWDARPQHPAAPAAPLPVSSGTGRCLSVCLSVCQPLYLSVCLSVLPPLHPARPSPSPSPAWGGAAATSPAPGRPRPVEKTQGSLQKPSLLGLWAWGLPPAPVFPPLFNPFLKFLTSCLSQEASAGWRGARTCGVRPALMA